ncbi:hypothetical protein GIY23_03945 [Allosaccharopolyspora coralli]|uniref:DUF6542 domain-containing protein n=1 Tax=Allosaccharopolyspora coralli TaxID=2665642 RepID=A0A5Q3QB20_9PSEU|nr:DUF6542 domain-containing protein [Allosaccharopolyspora coralli]QGK68809.1 hypothetical protein GIY23_03945 [Allosaccharopolyspora coralli]
MTATRERPSAPSPNDGALAWADRSAFPTMRGKAWWIALAFSVLPTALGTLADVLLWSRPGLLFTACFFVGSVMSVLLVRRRSVYGPMVTPPLVLAVTMPIVVLLAGSGAPEGGGTTATALALASPLINGFPTMAATTVATLVIGLVRMFVLERKPAQANADAPTRKTKPRKPASGNRAEKATAHAGEQGGQRPTATKQPRDERGRPTRDSGRGKEPGRKRPAGDRGETPARGGPGRGRADEQQPGKGRGGAPQPGRDRARDPQPGKGRNPAPPPGQGRTGQPQPGNGRGSEPPPGRGSTPPPGRRAPSRQAPERGEPPPARRRGNEPQRPPGNEPPSPPGGRPQRPPEKPQRPPENQPRPPGGPAQPPPGTQPPRRPRPPRRDPG